MDRFDQLTRSVATAGLTRRRMLWGLGLSAGMGLLALLGGARTVGAEPEACSGTCVYDHDCAKGCRCDRFGAHPTFHCV
jgi:hypothetical protein